MSAKPWLSWPAELPTSAAGATAADCPHLETLTSKESLRGVLAEARQQLFGLLDDARFAGILSDASGAQHPVAVLAGGEAAAFEFFDTDTDFTYFRQEPFFRYVFGVNEPGCMGVIDFAAREVLLFVPELPPSTYRWNGTPHPLEKYTEDFGVTATHWVKDLQSVLKERAADKVYLLDGLNTDSGLRVKTKASFDGLDAYPVDEKRLHELLVMSRVYKTPKEVELLRAACYVSSQAHVYMMRHAAVGQREQQLEALYQGWVQYYGGSRHLSYGCICCAGEHGAILHYGHAGRPNDGFLKDGDMMLLDLGAEFMGYATDITCSFPASGVFTDDQRGIYRAVRDAQLSVERAMKPGVSWVDMHRVAERVILRHLLRLGVCKVPSAAAAADGDSGGRSVGAGSQAAAAEEAAAVDQLMAVKVGALFMPHGLGHFMGMIVHDVGGFTDEHPRCKEEGPCWLRTTRTLEAGMVLTVEPGCYFNMPWITEQFRTHPAKRQFVDEAVLARFAAFGGVRLEDDVVVTADGIDNLTVVPRELEDVEEVLAIALAARAGGGGGVGGGGDAADTADGGDGRQ